MYDKMQVLILSFLLCKQRTVLFPSACFVRQEDTGIFFASRFTEEESCRLETTFPCASIINPLVKLVWT